MPPRTMWKGAISFGLVSIPVRMYPVTEEKSVKFNQLHEGDMGRIRYKRVCSVDGEEVPFEEIVKGYEIEKDRYVVLTDEDFDKVPVESSRAIDIQQFVELTEIDPVYFQKSYYLVPDETGAKAYSLLRQAMNDDGAKVGIAKVAFRDKEHLAALRFVEDVMVLETMYWPDEIRAADFDGIEGNAKVRPQEVQMAQALISSLTEPWDPSAYKDEYREALLGIVEKKAAGEEIELVEGPEPTQVVDLMAALKASVEAVKKGKEPADAVAEAAKPVKATRAKRASASKATAKKTATPERKRKAG